MNETERVRSESNSLRSKVALKIKWTHNDDGGGNQNAYTFLAKSLTMYRVRVRFGHLKALWRGPKLVRNRPLLYICLTLWL